MDDISYKEIDLFVREELSQHGEWLIDRFIEALERGKPPPPPPPSGSFNYETSSGYDGSQQLTVSFLTYGRLTEVMSRRRKQRVKDQKNHGVWEKKNHQPKKVAWYNKNRYAGYGRLIRRLTAGMSDHELQRIRGILNQAKADFASK